MKFCPDCDNIVLPRNHKLYCKACDKEFDLESEKDDFKIVKTIRHDEKETAPIVVGSNCPFVLASSIISPYIVA